MKIRDILTETLTPDTIHKLADSKGIKWDNEPSFLALTNKLTGKKHLDDLDQEGLKKIQQHLDQIEENFADGKNPQDKGDSQRHGIPKGATIAQLEKASHSAGRKGQLARWQINMRRGKKK